MTFYAGQKVVYIRKLMVGSATELIHLWGVTNFPKYNGVYTVRDVALFTYRQEVSPGLLLCELINEAKDMGPGNGISEYYFPAEYFRPLTERSTDTGFAILKKLLNPTHERIGA